MVAGKDRFGKRIGFMQGRLSPLVNGKIQAFPREHWREEFKIAARLGFELMEWTLDQEGLLENPLMTAAGRKEISRLSAVYGVAVSSLTGDCFMQAPFYKAEGRAREDLLDTLERVLESCAALAIRLVVLPLVDNGRLENPRQEESLLQGCERVRRWLQAEGLSLIFESDFPPDRLAAFMQNLPAESFGVNYDIGNSAALGFRPLEEIAAYGARVLGVHVKDRLLGELRCPWEKGMPIFRRLC